MSNATQITPFPPGLTNASRLALSARLSPRAAARFHARQEFSSLEAWLSAPLTLQLPLHQIESQQEFRGRELHRLLLQTHVQQRGNGDVGPALRVTQQFTTSLESTERMQELTGRSVSKRSLEEIIQDAAQDFDTFYAERIPAPWQQTASILVVAVDGKGIPMVKPGHPKRSARRTKGQKANRKKMATVAAVFTRQPWIRTPEQVVESLFRVPTKTNHDPSPPPKPENKRVWASLVKGKAAVVDEVVAEVHRRDPDARLTLVALTDGERALQILVSQKLNVILILDLLHVMEKVWKAAHVFHPEGTPDAEIYARLMTHRILEGNVGQVVKGLRQTVTKRNLSGSKAKILLSVAAYFHRNRDRMRYNDYLAQGLPIASGSVEGACKNLIKDRMERSGMRWTQPMAEALVKLRALYLSGDFNTYWDFHIREDHQRLYPPGRWAVVVK